MPMDANAAEIGGRDKSLSSKSVASSATDVVIYDSSTEVPGSFWRWSILWCGCCDPTYYITESTVQVTYCQGCGRTVDSLLFDNIWDVTRDKSCCCSCWNCCPCLDDVGDILLYGQDGVQQGAGSYRLKRIFPSKEIFDKLADLIQ